jgi:hypothetical protein
MSTDGTGRRILEQVHMQVQVELTYMCQGRTMDIRIYIYTSTSYLPTLRNTPYYPHRIKQDEQHLPRFRGCSPILLLGQNTLRSRITVHGVRPSPSAHRTTLLYCIQYPLHVEVLTIQGDLGCSLLRDPLWPDSQMGAYGQDGHSVSQDLGRTSYPPRALG